MNESIIDYYELFQSNKLGYIRDICELVGDTYMEQLLTTNPDIISIKKKKKKNSNTIEKKVYCKCHAFTQNGKQCTRSIYEKDKIYCGLHYKQPFGNIELGHIKKQKNTEMIET